MKVMKIDDVVGYFVCDYDGVWKKNYETENQFIIERVDIPDIAVIDKGTVVREGSKLSDIDAMKPLQMMQNIETEKYYQSQEKRILESKIMLWYVQTRDEKFREFFNIKIDREGKI